MKNKIVLFDLCVLDPPTLKNCLAELKKTSEGFVLLCVYALTADGIRFPVYTSNLIKLSHRQIKVLTPRLIEKFQKTVRSYQMSLPLARLVLELVRLPISHHANAKSLLHLRRRDFRD